jgi:hypothetical protein
MTSTEFAAKYRLLKNVAMRGARSFLAQQVALGRMVMVHYLDSETPQQRSATLARLNALSSPARDKLLEILDVDGSPVAVTLFLSSFVDFTTWIDQLSDAPVRVAHTPAVATPPTQSASPTPLTPPPSVSHTPGEFTHIFSKLESAPDAPRSFASDRAIPKKPVPQNSPGEFTQLFGAISAPGTSAPPSKAPKADEFDSPTLIMQSPSSGPPVAPKNSAPANPPAAPPQRGAESFTAIFGARTPIIPGHNSSPMPPQRDASQWPPQPAAPASSGGDMIMHPSQPSAQPIAAPSAPTFEASSSDKPGELTQMFRQMSIGRPPVARSDADAPAHSPGADLPPAFDAEGRPRGASLPADMSLPSPVIPPARPFGAAAPPGPISLGGLFSATPPAVPRAASPSNSASGEDASPNGRSAAGPPSPAWGVPPAAPNIGGLFGGSIAGQSEYTRVLHGVTLPPPPPVVIQAPGPEAASAAAGKKAKSLLPLIVALSTIGALTIAIVAYFVFAK